MQARQLETVTDQSHQALFANMLGEANDHDAELIAFIASWTYSDYVDCCIDEGCAVRYSEAIFNQLKHERLQALRAG